MNRCGSDVITWGTRSRRCSSHVSNREIPHPFGIFWDLCKKIPKIPPLLKKFCSQGISVLSAVELTKIFCKFFQSRYGNVMGVTKVLKTLFCKNFVWAWGRRKDRNWIFLSTNGATIFSSGERIGKVLRSLRESVPESTTKFLFEFEFALPHECLQPLCVVW